jgi:hypothetical protein
MDYTALVHGFSTWLLRIVVLGAAIAIGYIYMAGDSGLPGARIAAERLDSVDPGSCQPIGHTAKDELVYSMDCDGLPAPTTDASAKSK